jgi:hypothetical protein
LEGVLRLRELALVVSLSTKVTTKLESPFMTANGIWPCCQPSHRKPDIRGFYKPIRICSRLCPRSNARACAGMIWGGLGHSQLDIDVGQRKWRLSTSSSWVSVLNFVTLWASKRRGAQDGTCLACAGVVWWGAHPCLASAGFRARGGRRRTSTPYLHHVIHVHLPANLLY